MDKLIRKDLFRQACYINGQWVDSFNTIPVVNPADGSVLGDVPSLDSAVVIQAVESAHQAMAGWNQTTAKGRAQIMRRWFELVESHSEDLGRIMTLEQGKPLLEAQGEIKYAASFIEWFAEEGKRVYGDTIPSTVDSNRLMTIRQPIGVCGAVTPWNFPAAMITRKAAPALAAGCSIVVKPASETPFTALALAVLAEEAGIPPGVFNIVTGNSRDIGEILTTHPLIAKFSFTGSTGVGRKLLAQCASTIKKSSMELGGNAPFIVFDDADIDKAVQSAMVAKFRNGGQTCVCVNRFFVHDTVYEQFLNALKSKVAALKVGNGLDPETHIGPMINQKAIDGMQRLIRDAIENGASVLPLSEKGGELQIGEGYIRPVILSGVTADMAIFHEEIFGPVASIIHFSGEDEVIASANDTIYGLASYLFTNDIRRAYRVAEKLEYGMVGINTGMISNEVAPFGGVKQSGLGKEGSKYGIEDYLEVKYLCLDIG